MTKYLYLIFGGALGTASRYALSSVVYRMAGIAFPYGTFAVNISGCFLLGLLAAVSDKKFLFEPDIRLFLMVGFCGAYTTFATVILETDHLVKNGEFLRAFLNVFLSILVGYLFFRIGSLLGEAI